MTNNENRFRFLVPQVCAKMIVPPRSFRYSDSAPRNVYNEKVGRRTVRKSALPKTEPRPAARAVSPLRTATDPTKTASQPVAVPTSERSYSGAEQAMATRARNVPSRGTKTLSATHDPKALPPAVAALLAVTTIPPHQSRRRSRGQRRVSIDELVNEWKSDDTLKASYSSSSALSILLEDVGDAEGQCISVSDSGAEDVFLHTRSTSSESIPSLEADDKSVLSMGSPGTPGSLRSRKSIINMRRDKARALATSEDSSLDHPLVSPPITDEDDGLVLSTPRSRSTTPKARPSFTSNLTTSLRALKKATIGSIASFSLSNATVPAQRSSSPSRFSDEMLWSHPFIFPHFTPEMRPTIAGTPTQAQRRYLNPMPLTFEEQEAPFQQALHAPYLAERIDAVPTIPMQTYNRGWRKASPKRSGPDPNSEAGRTMINGAGVRQREPRENSDFLRVVVLEMNMRREGKLESGRARIWLPPRQVSAGCGEEGTVPKRWVGVSAY